MQETPRASRIIKNKQTNASFRAARPQPNLHPATEDFHTYFAGSAYVLTHNQCAFSDLVDKLSSAQYQKLRNWAITSELTTAERLQLYKKISTLEPIDLRQMVDDLVHGPEGFATFIRTKEGGVEAWKVLRNTAHATNTDFLEFISKLEKRGFEFEADGSKVKLISGSEGVELGKITDNGLDLEDFGYIANDLTASNVERLPDGFRVFDNGNDLTGKLEVVTDAAGNTKFRWSGGTGKPDWLKPLKKETNSTKTEVVRFPTSKYIWRDQGGDM